MDGIGESLRYVQVLIILYLSSALKVSHRQLAGADIILLNKVDLVPESQTNHLQTLIEHVNPAATIYRTVRGQIDLGNIMGIGAYGPDRLLRERRSVFESLSLNDAGHDHDHDCEDSCQGGEHAHHVGPHHYELRGISSLQVRVPVLTAEQLRHLDVWIRTALWENHLPEEGSAPQRDASQFEILRCKGIFVTKSGETHVLQGVRSLYEITLVEEGGGEDVGLPEEGKLVLIGKGLNQRVRRSLEAVVGLKVSSEAP